MDFQLIAVTVLVGLSFAYAGQALLPTAWRLRLWQGLSRWPLPAGLQYRLGKAAQKSMACSCQGCDRSVGGSATAVRDLPAGEAKIVFMRRPGA